MSVRRLIGWLRRMRFPIAVAIAMAAPGIAVAQGTGSVVGTWDYYRAGASAESVQALRNVEQYHIEPGVQRMRQTNYAGALEDFEFILNYFPNHPRALTLMSELCVKWKNPRCEAESRLERAIQINPKASQTYVIQGLHFQRLNARERAIGAYKQALDLNPASSNAHYNLGLAYFDLKRFDLANLHAQATYVLGFPLPGLRDKLTRAGHWKTLPEDEVKRVTRAQEKVDEKPAAEKPTVK